MHLGEPWDTWMQLEGPRNRVTSPESMAMIIITMISTRIDTQKRMGGDTALWLKAFVEVKK